MRLRCLFGVIVVLAGVASVTAGEWTSFRGPNHDGTIDEKIAWPKPGPRLVWKVPVGEGFGTVVTSGGKVFLTAEGGGQEALLALDAATGAAKWHVVLGRSIYEGSGGNGPRTTPAVDGKLVYAVSTFLKLAAVDAETGKLAWGHDLAGEFGGKSQLGESDIKAWGNAASPVVDGNAVFVYGGGDGQTFLAFDKATGKLLWKSGSEKITHAGPTVATIGGVRQVLFLTKAGVISLSCEDGKELWRYPFKFSTSTASTPIVAGDVVYCSAGYGVGAGAARVTKNGNKFTATEVWRNTDPDKLVNH